MQRVNEFVFYELAIKIHQLTDTPEAVKYSNVWYRWWQAREAVDEIYRQRPLHFTTPVATRLYRAITTVVPEEWEKAIAKVKPAQTPAAQDQGASAATEEPDISYWLAYEVREAAREFETVLRTECQLMDTYFVSKKGAYSTKDLVDNAHHHIPEPTRSKLEDRTQQDFDQAGKCIAFDVPTAAAFHLLRGTEVVIREYYDLIVPGAKRAPDRMRNWGAYIRLLNNHGAEKKITSLLLHLKDEYRNPVFHPEENYTDERVQVLFGVCISAVVLMKCEIEKRKQSAKSTAIPFPPIGTTAGTA